MISATQHILNQELTSPPHLITVCSFTFPVSCAISLPRISVLLLFALVTLTTAALAAVTLSKDGRGCLMGIFSSGCLSTLFEAGRFRGAMVLLRGQIGKLA